MANTAPEKNKHTGSEISPEVGVTDLTDQIELLKSDPPQVNLGVGVQDEVKEALVRMKFNELLETIRKESDHVYLLTWNGNKIPRGAKLGNKEITWIQNGVVTASDGSMIGTYDRVLEWGGNTKRDQAMLVFTRGESPAK